MNSPTTLPELEKYSNRIKHTDFKELKEQIDDTDLAEIPHPHSTYEKLLNGHMEFIQKAALTLTRDPSQIDDLIQIGAIAFWEQSQTKTQSQAITYQKKVLAAMIMYLNKEFKKDTPTEFDENLSPLSPWSEEFQPKTPEDFVIAEQCRKEIQFVLRQLTIREEKIIKDHFFEDKELTEIAFDFNRSDKRLKQIFKEIVEKLAGLKHAQLLKEFVDPQLVKEHFEKQPKPNLIEKAFAEEMIKKRSRDRKK